MHYVVLVCFAYTRYKPYLQTKIAIFTGVAPFGTSTMNKVGKETLKTVQNSIILNSTGNDL